MDGPFTLAVAEQALAPVMLEKTAVIDMLTTPGTQEAEYSFIYYSTLKATRELQRGVGSKSWTVLDMALLNDEESGVVAIEAGRWFHCDAVFATKELKRKFVRQDR